MEFPPIKGLETLYHLMVASIFEKLLFPTLMVG